MLTRLYARWQAALLSEKGATAVEYGVMVALIAAVIIAAVTLVGKGLDTLFRNVAGTLPTP